VWRTFAFVRFSGAQKHPLWISRRTLSQKTAEINNLLHGSHQAAILAAASAERDFPQI
jgi:hypothetical protein